MLSLDLEPDNYLYRIKRGKRIVYINILGGDIFPSDWRRAERAAVLKRMRLLPKWKEEWKTLTVRRNSQGDVESTPDEFPPHGLDLGQLALPCDQFFNLQDLAPLSKVSSNIFRVRCDGVIRILKLSHFGHIIPYLQQEISVYSALKSSGFPLAPEFIGFVYEETKTRTIGFVMEEIVGDHPGIQNLEHCTRTARLLHKFGFVHGDLNRYNFIMTEHGAKLLDFESAAPVGEMKPEEAEEELKELVSNLEDESGIGKPISI